MATVTLLAHSLLAHNSKCIARYANYRCIRELAPELSEKFPTICDINSYFFELKLTSNVSDRFFRSISTSLVNLKKIGQGHIFALSRDPVTWSKISHFQNMLGFTQYGSRLFGIDASSDPTKFQDDWPSGSPLIGAWSLAFAPNVLV